MELGGRGGGPQPRIQAEVQGGLLPAPPDGPLPGPADRDDAEPRKVGIDVEVHHHEVGTAGQAEIDIRYGTLLATADNVAKYKYVVKNTARQAGKTVTFMPKPIFMDNGSGMHTHQSLWNGEENLFWDELGYAQLSDTARWYIGGLLEPRAGAAGVRRADDELVPPAGAGLRGADQPGVLAAEPLGVRADPAVLQDTGRQASGVPVTRPIVQPVPRVPGDADGRASTGSGTRSSRRTRSTRTCTTCRPRRRLRSSRCRGRSRSR